MRKASWNIKTKLKRRLTASLVLPVVYSFFLGYYFHWSFYFLILLELVLIYFENKRSREKYLTGFDDRADDLVLHFIRPNFTTGKDVLTKDNLSFIEMSRFGIWTKFPMQIDFKYNGEWQSYKVLGKEAAGFLAEYITEANLSLLK